MAIGYMILAAGLIGAMGAVMGMSWQAIGEGWVWSVTMGSVLLHTETECKRTRALKARLEE
jgi:hypothetical protein